MGSIGILSPSLFAVVRGGGGGDKECAIFSSDFVCVPCMPLVFTLAYLVVVCTPTLLCTSKGYVRFRE